MLRPLIIPLAVSGLVISVTTAQAFQCPSDFKKADQAIANATKAMNAMSNKKQIGLVHTLLDDAKSVLQSGRHNHKKPAAGGYDHARAIAKAKTAIGYAEAAELLAKR